MTKFLEEAPELSTKHLEQVAAVNQVTTRTAATEPSGRMIPKKAATLQSIFGNSSNPELVGIRPKGWMHPNENNRRLLKVVVVGC